MKPAFKILALAAGFSTASHAAVIFTDNFNVADTGSLDGSDQTGRHSGTAANDVLLRSGGVQQAISGGQLVFKNSSNSGSSDGELRFQPNPVAGSTLFNFASGAGGTQILADGGFRFEFDWTTPNTTATDFVGLSIGNTTFDSNFQVADAGTDYGLLLRNNGGVQIFDSGTVVTAVPTFAVTSATHHAIIDFAVTSFADGSNVTATAYVDNVAIGSPVIFQFSGNSGVLNFQMDNNQSTPGLTLDNISITTIPEPSGAALLLLGGVTALGVRRRKC